MTASILTPRRLALTAWDTAPHALGGVGYGVAARDDALAPAGAGMRLLLASPACADAWLGGLAVHTGRTATVRWRHDGHWLFGALEVDEPGRGLEAPTLRAYRDVFATLHETGFTHLQRLWNYLPSINAEGQGAERYREFNAGRRQAFAEAGRSVADGSPAACALGTHGGPLALRFLAGRSAPVAVENPRQVSAYHYPPQYGVRAPAFSRAALVDAGGGRVALLISGTASIVGHQSRHPGDAAAQAREVVTNLRAVIEAAHAKGAARFDIGELECVVYVRHAGQAAEVRAVLADELGAGSATLRQAVWLEADICRADLLVEIEGHAVAAAGTKP